MRKYLFVSLFCIIFLFLGFKISYAVDERATCSNWISDYVVEDGKVYVYGAIKNCSKHVRDGNLHNPWEELAFGIYGNKCLDLGLSATIPENLKNLCTNFKCCWTNTSEADTNLNLGEEIVVGKPQEAIKYKPEVPIPGFQDEVEVGPSLLANYILAIYDYFLYVTGVLAVIVIMIAGFQWITAGGNQSKIGEAKERIVSAIIGLLLALGSFLILYTINPELVIMKSLNLESIVAVPIESTDNVTGIGGLFIDPVPDGNCPSYKTGSSCPDRGVTPNTSCKPDEIITAAKELLSCFAGPCHCVCFVMGSAKKAGCDLGGPGASVSGDLIPALRSSSAWKLAPTNYIAKRGDIITIKGHTMISMGGGQIIHSTPRDSASTSGDWWHPYPGWWDEDTNSAYRGCKSNQQVLIEADPYLQRSQRQIWINPYN